MAGCHTGRKWALRMRVAGITPRNTVDQSFTLFRLFMSSYQWKIACVVVSALVLAGFLVLRRQTVSDQPSVTTYVGPIPVHTVAVAMSSKQAFDEPLWLNESLAVRKGSLFGVVTLKKIKNQEIECEVECQGSGRVTSIFTNEVISICGVELRWSSMSKSSIFIYEDPLRRLGGTNCCEVAYPISAQENSTNPFSVQGLQWRATP